MENYAGLKNWKRNIAWFLAGQGVSLIGSSLVGYAIIWHVTLRTGSGTMLMAFTIAAMLPMFFMSPFGGVWADNYNRKVLINLADGFIAAVTLVIAITFFLGAESIWVLLICSVARSLAQGVQTPAVGSLIPQVVPEESLMRVNGINGMIMSVSMLGTPALAGVLYTLMPIQNILLIDVTTAIAAILLLIFFVKVPDPKDKAIREAEKKTVLADLKEGLIYINEHFFLKRFLIIVALFSFLLAPAALLTPLQVARNFGEDPWRLSVIEIAFSAGMAVGGLLMTTWGGFKNRTFTVGASFVLMSIMTIGLGVTNVFTIYCVFMAITGITAATGNTPAIVILQSKIEPSYMGRVFSIMAMISSVIMPLGTVVFGPLADRISLNAIIVVTGGLIAILGIYLFCDKTLVEAGKQDAKTAVDATE